MKFIVKNCPCNVSTDYICAWEMTNETYCKDCDECLIKEVIKKCKEETDPTQDQWTKEKENLAKEILQMFEIEEVE